MFIFLLLLMFHGSVHALAYENMAKREKTRECLAIHEIVEKKSGTFYIPLVSISHETTSNQASMVICYQTSETLTWEGEPFKKPLEWYRVNTHNSEYVVLYTMYNKLWKKVSFEKCSTKRRKIV